MKVQSRYNGLGQITWVQGNVLPTSTILVRRIDIGLLGYPHFHMIYSDHQLVPAEINSNESEPRMANYWKISTF